MRSYRFEVRVVHAPAQYFCDNFLAKVLVNKPSAGQLGSEAMTKDAIEAPLVMVVAMGFGFVLPSDINNNVKRFQDFRVSGPDDLSIFEGLCFPQQPAT